MMTDYQIPANTPDMPDQAGRRSASRTQERHMTNTSVLITGANKSIGFETARQLGRLGCRVWLGSRNAERGDAARDRLSAEGIDVRTLAIDVTDDASVHAAVDHVAREDGKLDILINNAGISGLPPIRVTQAFLPLLKAAGRGRVIMVSSGLGSLGWLSDPASPFFGVNILGYNSSKSALNAVTVAFAKELATFDIKVNAADPGYTATDFNGHSGYRTVEQAASGIVWLARQDSTGPTGCFYFEQQVVPW
jgi:NAD(P)-dependent dehydrogenase (short-subunit alcohol dehydrogenase family)